MLPAALAIGRGVEDDRGPRLAEFLDRVSGVGDLDHRIAGEEAKNIGIAQLRDLRRSRHGDERHLVIESNRHHRQHLRPEDRRPHCRDVAAAQDLFQRGCRALRRRAGIDDLVVDLDTLGRVLDRQKRTVALAAALERQYPRDRKQQRNGEFLGGAHRHRHMHRDNDDNRSTSSNQRSHQTCPPRVFVTALPRHPMRSPSSLS